MFTGLGKSPSVARSSEYPLLALGEEFGLCVLVPFKEMVCV